MTLVLGIWSFVRVAVLHMGRQVARRFELLSTLFTLVVLCCHTQLVCMHVPERQEFRMRDNAAYTNNSIMGYV